MRFGISFYLVAMMFIGARFPRADDDGLFFVMLPVAFVHDCRRGVLDWNE